MVRGTITAHTTSPFDRIRHLTEDGGEFWSARELSKKLGYTRWETFPKVITKAETACVGSGFASADHFRHVTKMVALGSKAQREIEDWHLTRYACYLVAQNADPSKEIVAKAQTYFATQTRRAELADATVLGYTEEERLRLDTRERVKAHNKHLAAAAQVAGVKTSEDFASFQNAGYQGLYGGLTARDIATRKRLTRTQPILDHMGSTELAANLFRITQTDDKLRREKVRGKVQANNTHKSVGNIVRYAIREIGGSMPEDLPTPVESIPAIKRKRIATAAQPAALPAPKRRAKRSR